MVPQSSVGLVKNVERTPEQLDTIQNLSRVARLYIYEKKRLNKRHILDTVMSEEGVGSTFTVTLPIAKPEKNQISPATP